MLTEEGFKIRVAALRKEEEALSRERERLERDKARHCICRSVSSANSHDAMCADALPPRSEATARRGRVALQQGVCYWLPRYRAFGSCCFPDLGAWRSLRLAASSRTRRLQ